ncbi:uncharacterized protein LOC133814121 [Humulus lupulus]|uniref:uncharacterized protein LOC133814121 n=1 Tax=Humulus lupulus TaxID=3486 RepID=UPI002B403C1A|nr:uncharacterized protein LOC133814121 [Humulus lupulus]
MERQRGSPFSEHINQLPIPVKFKMPTWKMYTRLEDPVSHVHNFELHTDILEVRDDAWCTTTLPEIAQQWFFKLQPKLITSWDGFVCIFYSQFSSAMPLPAESNDLVDIKQRDNEPLKDHIQRFMRETTRVKSLSDDEEFIKVEEVERKVDNPSQTAVEQGKIDVENTTNPAEGGKNGAKNDKRSNGAGSSGNQNDNKKPKTVEQPKPREYVPKFTTYFILLEPRADVFNATQAVVPYRRPPPMRKEVNIRDMTKFC